MQTRVQVTYHNFRYRPLEYLMPLFSWKFQTRKDLGKIWMEFKSSSLVVEAQFFL